MKIVAVRNTNVAGQLEDLEKQTIVMTNDKN